MRTEYNPGMDVDIVIIGGGLAGAALGAGLVDGGHRVAVVERKAPPAPSAEWDSRVYTLTPASIAFLEQTGAWQRVPRDRVAPIYDMRVFGDEVGSRLDFSAYESGLLQLGATAESGRLHHALWQGLERQRNLSLICPRFLRSCAASKAVSKSDSSPAKRSGETGGRR